MHKWIKFFALFLVVFCSSCNNNDPKPASPEVEFIHLQISMLNELADELNNINSINDAYKVKRSAAQKYLAAFAKDNVKQHQLDEAKFTQALAQKRLFNEYFAALKNTGEAMKRLSQEHPESYRVVAKEINKIYKSNR